MKSKKHNRLILLFLSLLFIAPGLSAYLFYMHPQWLHGKTINKGHFLNPARPLKIFHDQKWRIVLWSPKGCEAECIKQLDQLARVRLALGRRFYNVELWAMQPEDAPSLTQKTLASMKEYDIRSQALNPKDPKVKAIISQPASTFIVNPTGYLILEYNDNSKPDDIFHDIKHLLVSSEAST
jgi:hypothetical protein